MNDPGAPSGRIPETGVLLAAAIELARDAGAVLLEGFGRRHAPERKGRTDLVTEFDRRSERLLLDGIRRRFPDHAVLAEESGAHEGATAEAQVRWLVDPLDGTTNFAHNYPFFCVSVAAEVAGRLVAAAVYDPVREELFSASLGAGATLNGEPIRVSTIERVEDALLVTGFAYDVREHPEKSVPLFEAFLVRAQGLRRDGSAALNLCYLAMGRFDGFWEDDLAPWDLAAGVLVVREAGGQVTNYVGGEFRLEGKQLLASNGVLHEEMRAILSAAGGNALA
ncbi:MAG TPA: inositol monophosphatase family protein [Candidatus Limnocylindria bacterium]|nr:inositol monophosphatase family protein [Candidatus Limnocylindria bacterium]